jgi:hypothetical protein
MQHDLVDQPGGQPLPGDADPASQQDVLAVRDRAGLLQPGSRFWLFQWIEGGWLLALSLLLIAATVWLVRRRAA